MALPIITVVGNLTVDPELRFTASGAALVKLRVAASDRRKNADTGAWEDGDTTFIDVTAWRQLAENVARSLRKGDRIVATGRLKSRTAENAEGQTRTYYELDADEVGPALSRGTAKLQKIDRSTGVSTTANAWNAGPAQDGEVPF